jgi:hypothetical protein
MVKVDPSRGPGSGAWAYGDEAAAATAAAAASAAWALTAARTVHILLPDLVDCKRVEWGCCRVMVWVGGLRRGMDDVELLGGMRTRLAFLYYPTAGSFEMIRRVRGHALLA